MAADLDLDGDPDVAVASYDDGRVSWYRNLDGKGHFGPQTLVDDLTDARSVAVIDIDHNALPDVVAITGTVADATLIYPASAPGVFASLPVTKGAAWGQVKGKAGDVDGDGSADLVVLGFYELVLLRSSNGFATEKLGSFTGGFDLCIADVDHDGDRDLVVAAYADTNFVLVYPNTDGFGHFGTGFRIIRENIWALAAGDMDGNGQTDLVMAGDGHIFWRAGSTIVSTQAPPNLLRVVRVWPNPFTDMLLFNDERDVTTPCVFELFNLAGQRLLSCVVQGSSRIAVPVLPGGLYGYRVREIRDGALIGAGRVVRK